MEQGEGGNKERQEEALCADTRTEVDRLFLKCQDLVVEKRYLMQIMADARDLLEKALKITKGE